MDDPSITDGDVLVVTREREQAVRLFSEDLAELETGIALSGSRRDHLRRRAIRSPASPRVALTLQLRVSRRAAREIERIVQWWAINRPAAPDAVLKELRNVLDLLLVQPDIGAPVAMNSDLRAYAEVAARFEVM